MKIPKREGACGRERRIPICRRVSRPILLLGLGAALSYGQFTNVTNNTSTPIAGAGHDYRQFLSETVSPANGSLSVRIQVPVPKNRGVTVPFSFDYDSNGVNNLAIVSGTGYWEPGSGYLIQGGWSYGIPLMTAAVLNWPSLQKGVNCPGQYDYVFTNSAGERHAFAGLTLFINAPGSCPSSSTLGGDDDYTAQISNGNVLVADRDGTVFTFEGFNHNSGNPYTSIQTALPTTIEDRNGNVVSVADPGNGQFTFTDSAGRPVLSSSGFATASTTAATYSLTVSGLAPYQVTWGTAASNFDLSSTTVTGNACGGLNSYHGSQPVVTAITLPNGQQYQFQYESTYGLLSKVIYPNGAYSRYSWAPNSLSDAAIWPGMANQQYYCTYLYSTPAVQNRYVSFDGVNEVLEEDYSYATTWSGAKWSSKSSTVTTTVRDVQNGSLKPIGSFATNYTYSSTPAAENTYDAQLLAANIAYQIPIEQSVVYNDFGGAPLKTDTKTWLDQFLMSSETVALNDGSTSENIYSYYPNGQLETEMEYDYGANAPGALLRKTVFNYQGFPAAPIFPTYSAILDRPCQVVTFDKSGTNRVAETDYYYDGGTTLCGTAGTPSVSAVTSLTGHDETNYAHTSTAPRGNVTQESRQNIQLSTAATSTYAYDETGQVKSATDPRGNTRGYSYADSYASGFGTPPGQTNAYLTQLTLPNTGSPAVNHVEKFTYRYDDGQLASSSDQNSAPNYTDYIYADPLGRLTETDYPDSGKTTVTYNDTASPPTVVTKRLLGGSTYLTSTTVLDGAGHAIQSQLNSDPSGTDNTNTVYDGLGRVFSVSNPYRSTNDSTYGITLYTYDGLGRTTNVTTPDGAIASTSYSGPKTTVTDQAGRQRTMTADALGRIKQVVEDPGSPVCSLTVPQPCHFNYSTTYTYDALDDLTGVNQSNSLTRTFTYDSLKRLTQAINPESGTINYTYDLNGNLFTKTDAHPTTITYGYDALNRITGKQYSDKTPAVSYTYDLGVNGIGLLSSVANGSSTTNYLSFDALGRVLASNQVTGSQTYPFSYTYNLAGSVMTETYPSGRTITTGYDGANRPDAVTGVMSGAQTNYVAGVSYAPAGGPTLYQYGNNLWRQISYNNRLQMSGFIDLVNNSTGSELLNVGLTWGTTNNNGNLQSAAYKNGGPGYPVFLTFNETYSYDALNRLTSAGDSGWSRSFGYDAFGNMWVTANSGITLAGNTPTTDVFNANNQIAGTSYDAAGNQTLVNGDTQAYDAENRQISSTFAGASETYLYDGNGQRVEKSGAIGATVFVYDAMGKLAAEYSTAANASPCTTCYLSADHLGSTRLVTDSKANVIGRHDYLPFGEEIAAGMAGRNGQSGAGNDTVNQKFTGKERDQESGLDYFGSRYYGSALGRWVSPDRVNLTEDRLVSPTNTLNKYVYGGNNPLKFVDPDGEDITLFYTNGGPGGHAMLLAYDQSNGNSAVQSFGPANHSNSTELEMAVGIPVPGTANYGFADIKSADELRQDYSSVTIQTSPEETEKAIQYIKNHSDGNYNTYTNNCTTTCARILRLLNLHAWGEFIPRSLFDNVVDQYSHTAPKTNMPWTEQHGRDYGNPRPGYNAFDLLFLSIQNQQQAAKKPKEVVKSKICFNDDNGNQSCSSGN